jgi:hypothetical protein
VKLKITSSLDQQRVRPGQQGQRQQRVRPEQRQQPGQRVRPEQQARPEQQEQQEQRQLLGLQQELPICCKQPATEQRSTRRAEQSVSFIFPFPS